MKARKPQLPARDPIDVPAWLRDLPKVELHLHLEGSIEPETLVALSQRHDAHPLTLADARALYTYKDFLGFMDSFKAMSQRLHTPEDYELITYNMVRALAAQGIVHAEVYISFGIIFYWHKVEVEPYVEAIERARIRGEKEFGTTIYWLIDAVRHFGAEEASRVFRKAAELRAQYPSIVGIGIGGDEARGPASLFKDSYAEARAAGLRLTAHAGESGGPIDGPASIWAAINIGAERIGHGLAAQHDAELLARPRRKADPHRDQRHLQHPHRLLHQLSTPTPCAATSTPASWSPSTPTTRPCSAPTCSTNTSSPTTATASPSTSSANSPPTPSKPASSPPPAN